MKPKSLFLLLFAAFFWGGTSAYFAVSAPKYFQRALDGAEWRPASGGLVPVHLRPDGPADRAGLILTDTLLAANGVSVASETGLQAVIDRTPIGRRVVYTVRRGDNLISLEIQPERDWSGMVLHWLLKLAGFLYIFLSLLVFWKKPDAHTAKVFLFFGMVAGSLLAASFVDEVSLIPPVRLYFIIWLFFNIFFVMPFALDFVRRLMFFAPPHTPPRELSLLTYLPSIIGLGLCLTPLVFSLIHGQGPVLPSGGFWFELQKIIIPTAFALYLLWFFIEISVRAGKRQFVINHRQGTWLRLGVGYPMTAYTVLGMLLPVFFNPPVLKWSSLFLLPPPFVLAYLILKERLLDVGVIIKRSAIYAILSVLLIATIGILAFATSKAVVLLTGQESQLSIFAAVFISAVVVHFYREKTQSFLDRQFFKDRHNYQLTLLEFSKELAQLEKLDLLLAKTSKRFAEALHLSNCLPFIYDHPTESYRMVSPYGATDPVLEKVRFSASEFGLATLLVKEARPLELYDLETNPLFAHLPVADKVALKKMETALAVPFLVKNKLVGMLLLGNKKSGDLFNSDDVDFFATLSASLAVAVENARLYKEELEKREMERELSVARQIQERLVACCRLPEISGVDVATTYLPSRQVSGDLFTVLPARGGQLAVAVGDVAGKGVPASLLMATVLSSLTTLVEQKFSPIEIMQRLNRLVYANTEPQHFVTFFLGLFEVESRRLNYVNAGHNPPLYFSPGGRPKELTEGGLLLGMLPEVRYETGELSLSKNAPVVLYTDGVTEAENHSEEQFGTGRLMEIVESNRHRPAKELGERILSGLKGFCDGRELGDDVSLVILKVT